MTKKTFGQALLDAYPIAFTETPIHHACGCVTEEVGLYQDAPWYVRELCAEARNLQSRLLEETGTLAAELTAKACDPDSADIDWTPLREHPAVLAWKAHFEEETC